MTPTAAQIRQACALLNWKTTRLSRAAGVGYDVARKARDDAGLVTLSGPSRAAIREAIEKAGVEFMEDGTVRMSGLM